MLLLLYRIGSPNKEYLHDLSELYSRRQHQFDQHSVSEKRISQTSRKIDRANRYRPHTYAETIPVGNIHCERVINTSTLQAGRIRNGSSQVSLEQTNWIHVNHFALLSEGRISNMNQVKSTR